MCSYAGRLWNSGGRPSHVALLDWLAADFVEHGWDVKRLMRQMVMSATYRQSSDASEEKRRIDPENRLLSRAPSFRLSAEMLRDGFLAASGLLDRQIGGPSVNPYEVTESFKPKNHDSGTGLYRRSVYTYWKRTGPPPAMMTLDASKRDVCRLRRERTSSPLQSFVLMNGPQFVEAARFLALNAITHCEGDGKDADSSSVIDHLFETLAQRKPSESEVDVVRKLFDAQMVRFEQDPASAEALLNVGVSKVKSNIPATRWAAWTVVASALMNFDHSVMRR
ncbi:MAG: DUF1553 domain-containing protein [Pirellulaceae bacterium]